MNATNASRSPSASRCRRGRRPRALGAVFAATCLALALGGCTGRPLDDIHGGPVIEKIRHYTQSLDKQVDILFVIDNSPSMEQEQALLAKNFPKLIEALRMPQLANRLPDVRIGVITPDLGAKNQYCSPRGDGAKLLRRGLGCSLPTNPWISYNSDSNSTNVPGSGDPIERIKQAFTCMAKVGTSGCGFEQPLEAAKRALDPRLKINPGFLRPNALLAVVFITDEDDCSAVNPDQLFGSPHNGPLGPQRSFRCFKYGFTCDQGDAAGPGPRTGCVPKAGHLENLDQYIAFFKGLKGPGRTIVTTIAGPTGRVEVLFDPADKALKLASSCGGSAIAEPALRLGAFAAAFQREGSSHSICDGNFAAPMSKLGKRIITDLGSQCVPGALLSTSGALVCRKGDTPGSAAGLGGGAGGTTGGTSGGASGSASAGACTQSCLDQASCNVTETNGAGKTTSLPRCAPAQFNDPSNTSCGEICPCWRIVPRTQCGTNGSAPYGFEVLRRGDAPAGAVATFRCRGALVPWSSPALDALPRCQ